MNRVLFILPTLPEYGPYVFNYMKIAEDNSVEYDIICWNRKGIDATFSDNYFVYQHPTNDTYSSIRKIVEIWGFYRFAKGVMRNRKYNAVFTFTIADSVFFQPYLKRKYRGRYVFDIRDYSAMLKNSFFLRRVEALLRYSACNVISSEGFKAWLPKQFEYLVCHNVSTDKLYDTDFKKQGKDIVVLTIGALRDADITKKVISVLSNRDNIILKFVGDGNALPSLMRYSNENGLKNVQFYGRYKKEEEDSFVMDCDMMNIVIPHNINSDSLMTNRLYLAVRYHRPIITNKGNYQAEIVRQYGLGVVIDDLELLYDTLFAYWKNLDWVKYSANCKRFLDVVCADMKLFQNKMVEIMLSDSGQKSDETGITA